MNNSQRKIFDRELEQILLALPDHLQVLLEEVPLIVEDEPSSVLLQEMGLTSKGFALCGLHSGIPLTERSVHISARLPDRLMLFRGPIMWAAGFAHDGRGGGGLGQLQRQIRITILHEIGHHFGLDEDDLVKLGYG